MANLFLQFALTNQKEIHVSPNTKTVKPYISPDRDLHEFDTQAQNFPAMQIDERLLQPLEEDLLPGEIILLDWSDHKSEHADLPVYFEYTFGIDASSVRRKLLKLGYLETASPAESLRSLRVPELKNILRDNQQKISGKKFDLVQRIIKNIDEASYSTAFSDKVLICTTAGKSLLEKYGHLVWAHKHNSKDGVINVATALTQPIEELLSSHTSFNSQAKVTNTFRSQLAQYDTHSYEILGVLDKNTCAKCGEMDNKVFQVYHAESRINLPPFHDGCRCIIVPHISGLPSPNERSARNPKTGKSEYTSLKNYTEWRKDMIQKYGSDVFN